MSTKSSPKIRSTNQDRNIILPPIRGNIIRRGSVARIITGGDLPEPVNLRQFKADLPTVILKQIKTLIGVGDTKQAYDIASDWVVTYFLNETRTYDFENYDHGAWVEIILDLANNSTTKINTTKTTKKNSQNKKTKKTKKVSTKRK